MMKTQSSQKSLWGRFALIAVLLLFNGCVALQPLPNAARAGDTITLAVGSADGMTATNTIVEFYPGPDPDLVSPILVPIRSIVKVNPDKTSDVWLSDSLSIPRRSSHGGWLSVVVVDLPNTLPEGDGVIRVTTNGEVTYPRFAATANGTDIPMTILPGTGLANPFNYTAIEGGSQAGDLARLEPKHQAVIIPPVAAEGAAELDIYGAIEINVTVPIQLLDSSPVGDADLAVVLDDQPQTILNQTNLFWKRVGDDFTIMLISPIGMYSYQARVSIASLLPDNVYAINGPPLVNNVTYYDLNGVPATGPMPSISVIN